MASARKKPTRPACRAKTKAGKACRNQAMPGSQFCASHGGAGKLGAPEKILEPGVTDKIIEAVEAGLTYAIAAQHAGVHVDTFQKWRKKGKADLVADQPETPYAQLVVALQNARATGEVSLVKRIREHGMDDWRANAFLLERRFPERWARRDKVNMSLTTPSEPREVRPEGEKRDQIIATLEQALRKPAGP